MKTTEVNNLQNIIDSRDIIARIEELEGEKQTLLDNIENFTDDGDLTEDEKESLEIAKSELEEFNSSEDAEKLKILKALANQCESCSDWEYGETLIRESYFEDYCQELCEDIGDIPKDLPHYIVIDWEATARNIKQDYLTVNFDGVDYLIRA